jgi:hypothetical protein
VRRGARPHSNVEQLYRDRRMRGPVLTPTTPRGLSRQAGMRLSLGGTQARGEAESHGQDAYVAEVSYGKPVMGEPEHP